MKNLHTTLGALCVAVSFGFVAQTVKADDWASLAVKRIKSPPLGLPSVPIPVDNQVTKQKLELGKKLFFDSRLSKNNALSCAGCHIPDQGFTNNHVATTIGVAGEFLARNAPTILNVAYQRTLFHDARETTLENQVYGPLLSKLEMGNPSIGWIIQTINGSEDYWGKFEKAFGEPVNVRNIGQAIATYERSLISANSPFDKWYFGKQQSAVSEDVKLGFKLFKGKGQCARCHLVKPNTALFTDQKLHDTGLVTAKKNADTGRMEVTGRGADKFRFKTPTLRNIALTAPYMHNGQLKTLASVVAFYNQGSKRDNKRKMPVLHLSDKEQALIVEFLKSLNGDNVQALIIEASKP